MKSLAIVTDSVFRENRKSNLGNILKTNILEVFSNNIVVKNYYIDTLNDDTVIDEDLVIVMAGSRALKVKKYVKNKNGIIVTNRTFLKSSVYPIFSIPNNSDVLIVNNALESVLESVSALYHIGVRHVNLIPFEQGKDYHGIEYAVSPSEPELVPKYIKNIFDVGDRVIDISTMLLIISKLEVNDKETQKRLYNYYQKVFSSNDGIIDSYNNLLSKTDELDFLLDLSHEGILLTDESGKIIVANKKFKELFEIEENIIDKFLHHIIPNMNFSKYYNKNFQDDLITYKKTYINLEKQNIVHFNQEQRMYFTFQEVTYIKKLEQNLSQKLRQKGQIARYSFDDIICASKSMKTIIEISRKIAGTDLTVLITGESGTGKEVLAQAIHNASSRRKQPFIAINGAAIPDNLLESELFGYVSGSFTGALKTGKKGLFEKANNGTIFLDEIGDMPNHLQSKLLRVLQERQITPIGSDNIIDIDVRVIAATHKDPIEMIKTGSFRKDLFYRLNVFPIQLPPLKDRIEDIEELLHYFTENKFEFTNNCIEILKNHDWPGNIRELFNVSQYISTLQADSIVDIKALPLYLTAPLNNSPYEKEKMIIEEKIDFLTAISVLSSIDFLNTIKKTAGRKHLMATIEKKGDFIEENALKKTIAILNSLDFIIIKKGRSGNFITEKGKDFLKKFDLNSK